MKPYPKTIADTSPEATQLREAALTFAKSNGIRQEKKANQVLLAFAIRYANIAAPNAMARTLGRTIDEAINVLLAHYYRDSIDGVPLKMHTDLIWKLIRASCIVHCREVPESLPETWRWR